MKDFCPEGMPKQKHFLIKYLVGSKSRHCAKSIG